jgi:hypothetical protein
MMLFLLLVKLNVLKKCDHIMDNNYVGWIVKTDTKILLTGTHLSTHKVVPLFDILILQNV